MTQLFQNDVLYDASDFATYFSHFATEGVLPFRYTDRFHLTYTGEGQTFTLSEGMAVVSGYVVQQLETDITFSTTGMNYELGIVYIYYDAAEDVIELKTKTVSIGAQAPTENFDIQTTLEKNLTNSDIHREFCVACALLTPYQIVTDAPYVLDYAPTYSEPTYNLYSYDTEVSQLQAAADLGQEYLHKWLEAKEDNERQIARLYYKLPAPKVNSVCTLHTENGTYAKNTQALYYLFYINGRLAPIDTDIIKETNTTFTIEGITGYDVITARAILLQG